MAAWTRTLRALFVAYVAATLVHVGWVMHHEPFSFDAWNVANDTRGEPITLARFFAYWRYEYTHSNPRLGQPLTYLAYKVVGFAEVVTPLAFLAIAVAVVAIGLGRLPSWKRGRDLAFVAMALGFSWFAYPQLGKTMFCRAYGANYLYGAAMQLWFLVPLRLSETGRASTGKCVAYALAGIAAGLCNEHTGPALCLFLVLYAWWKRAERPTLVWAGAAGAIVGFAMIFFAPGQDERYSGLAQRVSLPGRLLQRGLTGNLEIFRELVLGAAPLLALMVIVAAIGFVRDELARDRVKRAVALIGVAMAAGTLIAMTIFVSPKLGPRFYLFSIALLVAGFIALADAALADHNVAPFVALAVIASAYAVWHTVPLYGRLARASDQRLAELDATKRGTIPTIDAFEQVDDSWWFLGDDFRDILKRKLISDYYDLGGVVLRAYDPTAPLGVSDVRLVPSVDGACIDSGFELGQYRGLDAGSIETAMRDATRAARLQNLDLEVEFVGDRPTGLPRPHVWVGKQHGNAFEGWAGAIVRKTHATTRDIELPPEPNAVPRGFDIYIYQVGDVAKRLGSSDGGPLQYVPWRTGVYWALACRADDCFVIATAHQAS
jgi:Family of unknown function (DUF6056)